MVRLLQTHRTGTGKVAEQREGDLVVAKINADEEPELLRKNGVELLPTLKLFRNGESKGQIVAPGTKAEIDAFIQESLGDEHADL